MKYVKLILIMIVTLMFQSCVSKNLSESDVVLKAVTKCEKPEISIIQIPSRGLLADAMSITAVKTNGNDGGFYKYFSQSINQGFDNIGIYCPNSQKTEAILSHTLSLYKNNELQNISICVLGMENSQELLNEATRTGSSIVFVP